MPLFAALILCYIYVIPCMKIYVIHIMLDQGELEQ